MPGKVLKNTKLPGKAKVKRNSLHELNLLKRGSWNLNLLFLFSSDLGSFLR
jgi:hypothetical protein